MMMPSASTQTCNASSSEALLEVLFDTTSPSSSAMVVPHGGVSVSVVVPSNGTVVDTVRFRHGDPIVNLTACLSRSTCYGVEIVNARMGSFSVIYDGQVVTANEIHFPYYVTNDGTATSIGTVGNSSSAVATMTTPTPTKDDSSDDDDSTLEPYESNLTFVELIPRGGEEGPTSCVPNCHFDNETLHEVITYGGNYGEGTLLGWRIQDEQGRSLMGCQDDDGGGSSSSGGRCGMVNGVRVARACLPRIQGCRQFVMGHPQHVPSEGSMAAAQGHFSGGNSSEVGDGGQETGNRWVGHYHPSYRVSVDGNVVAEGSSVTFASAEIGGGDDDRACSRCSPNETLLEIFQYQTVPLQYTLRDVQTDQPLVSSPSGFGNSSVNQVLRYVRRCIPSSKCYDLAFSRAASSDGSSSSGPDDSAGVSTKVVLGGAHFANTMVRELPFRLILGERCDRQVACQRNESLVRVDIRTSGSPQNESQHIPGYYLAWSLFDAIHPPSSRMPEMSTTYFSNGYPGGGRYVHYQCVPCPADPLSKASSFTSFGMLNSVSQDDVSWSLDRNGEILGCRERRGSDSASPHAFLNDFILTPLDGSCLPPFSSDHSSNSSGPPPEAMMTCFRIVVGIVVGIAAMVGLLGVAVFYAGAGGDEAEIAGSAGGGAGRRRSSSTGTVCEDESVGSVEETGGP